MTVSSNVVYGGTVQFTGNATISKYLEVANVGTITTSVADRMQVANTNALVNDRLQVSNAAAIYATSEDSTLTGNTIASSIFVDGLLTTNSLIVQSNTGLILTGGGLTSQVPATSNAVSENISAGTIWYSNNHLYIAVDDNTIKRITLSTF
jgi:hypothetical protein